MVASGVERHERHGVRRAVACITAGEMNGDWLRLFSRLSGVMFLPPEVMMMSVRPVTLSKPFSWSDPSLRCAATRLRRAWPGSPPRSTNSR